MSVYRELAAELRANKAVIDSLNSRNEQLLKQNQRLKQEIHHVVQAALTLGQAAGVARPAGKDGLYDRANSGTQSSSNQSSSTQSSSNQSSFSNQDSPDSLAKLVRFQSEKQTAERQKSAKNSNLDAATDEALIVYEPLIVPIQSASPKVTRSQVPKPISENHSAERSSKRQTFKSTKNANRQPQAGSQFSAVLPKLFTEKSGDYRSSALERSDEKEIGGIWLALSIVLIIMTAFGAGFLIMKPLLNER